MIDCIILLRDNRKSKKKDSRSILMTRQVRQEGGNDRYRSGDCAPVFRGGKSHDLRSLGVPSFHRPETWLCGLQDVLRIVWGHRQTIFRGSTFSSRKCAGYRLLHRRYRIRADHGSVHADGKNREPVCERGCGQDTEKSGPAPSDLLIQEHHRVWRLYAGGCDGRYEYHEEWKVEDREHHHPWILSGSDRGGAGDGPWSLQSI